MRYLTDHLVVDPSMPPDNGQTLVIAVLDEPGHGGANHVYAIEAGEAPSMLTVNFQNGPIKEAGVNGVTHEALLAILADRLRGFQSGPYHSDDNATALAHINAAQAALQKRTRERMARGVEGTHQL
jgi:hypothetical protein